MVETRKQSNSGHLHFSTIQENPCKLNNLQLKYFYKYDSFNNCKFYYPQRHFSSKRKNNDYIHSIVLWFSLYTFIIQFVGHYGQGFGTDRICLYFNVTNCKQTLCIKCLVMLQLQYTWPCLQSLLLFTLLTVTKLFSYVTVEHKQLLFPHT